MKQFLGIDTNVLVRYLLQDDEKQSALATQFIQKTCDEGILIFIAGITLCELVWVLESAYEYPKKTIAEVLEKILRTKEFHFNQSEVLWNALDDYKKTSADFSDSYIGHYNRLNHCDYTLTFDKKAAKLSLFKLLAS